MDKYKKDSRIIFTYSHSHSDFPGVFNPPPQARLPHSSLPLLANWNLRRGGSSSLGVWREHIHRSSIYLTIFLSIYLSYQFDCLYWICDNNTRTYYSGADIGGGGFCPSSTPWYYFHVCTIFNVWTTFK